MLEEEKYPHYFIYIYIYIYILYFLHVNFGNINVAYNGI